MKNILLLVLFLSVPAVACEESNELPHKLQRLVDSGIVTVNYETEEVTCDTKRSTKQTCEAVGEAFAEYFYNQRHKFYKHKKAQ